MRSLPYLLWLVANCIICGLASNAVLYLPFSVPVIQNEVSLVVVPYISGALGFALGVLGLFVSRTKAARTIGASLIFGSTLLAAFLAVFVNPANAIGIAAILLIPAIFAGISILLFRVLR
jgi:hypothetical protein